MRLSVVLVLFLLVAAPAAAQSTSISASMVGDITRFSHAETSGPGEVFSRDASLDGEALGFNIAVGRALGEKWGVAFEAGRSGEIEGVSSPWSWLATTGSVVVPTLPVTPTRPIPVPPPFPQFPFELRTEQQYTTVSALMWARHSAGERIELSYFGGLTFVRSEVTQGMTIGDPRLLAIWALPAAVTTVAHESGPAVGIDASFKFTDHTAFTAGIRMHAIGNSGQSGWLIRPGLGVRWTF
jgi:hypothetical protein